MGDPGRKDTVSDKEILRLFVVSPDPAFLASELAQKLPLERQGVHYRLERLEDEGYIDSKKAGGRRLWWITQEGQAFFAESEES